MRALLNLHESVRSGEGFSGRAEAAGVVPHQGVKMMESIEVQDLAMCRAVRGSAVCVDLANAELDAERLVKSLAGLVAAGALPAGVADVARHLADVLEGAAILAGA